MEGSPTACLRCGNLAAELIPTLGDYSEFSCPNCGPYRVTGTMERLIELGTVDPRFAHIEEHNGHQFLVAE